MVNMATCMPPYGLSREHSGVRWSCRLLKSKPHTAHEQQASRNPASGWVAARRRVKQQQLSRWMIRRPPCTRICRASSRSGAQPRTWRISPSATRWARALLAGCVWRRLRRGRGEQVCPSGHGETGDVGDAFNLDRVDLLGQVVGQRAENHQPKAAPVERYARRSSEMMHACRDAKALTKTVGT